ncbi:MAG: 50S ribosomal protein L15e [Candidatus Aenigmatarchaeota archaeon]
MKSFYRFLRNAWKTRKKEKIRTWNKENVIVRIERPTRPDRAHALGYKAKQGFVIARIRIRKGGRRRPTIRKGRKPGKTGLIYLRTSQSKQAIAEKRVARKFPNLEILNSYYVGEDGKNKYYEVIMVDPNHPEIKSDPDINWVCNQRRRVFRGLTSAAKKSRGL